MNFSPSTSNPIIKNVTVEEARLSEAAFYSCIVGAALVSLLCTGMVLHVYNKKSAGPNALEMRTLGD